jgi:hypothetical protein
MLAMAERTRMIIDTDDDVKRAVKLRLLKVQASDPDANLSSVVTSILREALAVELGQLGGLGDAPAPAEPAHPTPAPKKKK